MISERSLSRGRAARRERDSHRTSAHSRRAGLDREVELGTDRLPRTASLRVDRGTVNASRPSRRRLAVEAALVAAITLAIGIAVGAALSARGVIGSTSIAGLDSAHAILDGGFSALPPIDASTPPLYTVLLVPFALVDNAGTALVLLTSLVGSATAASLYAILAGMGVGGVRRALAIALVVLAPSYLFLMAAGLPAMIGVTAVLLGFYGLVNWLRYSNLQWLLLASLTLTAASLAWYPALGWSLVAITVLALHLALTRAPLGRAVGILIVFAAPLVFCCGLWTAIAAVAAGELVPWFGANVDQGITFSDPGLLLTLCPYLAALGVALGVYARRRPDLATVAIAALLVGPVAVAVAFRALTDGSLGFATVFGVLIPAAALALVGTVLAELGPRARLATGLAVAGLIVAGHVVTLLWMAGEAPQAAVREFGHLFV